MTSTRGRILAFSAGLALLVNSILASHAQTNAAVVIAPVAPTDLPQGAKDVVKLFCMGKKDNVLTFYVNFSGLDCHLSVDDIVYLKAVGISGGVINAMMEVDKERQKTLVVRTDEDHYLTPNVASAPVPVQQPAAAAERAPDYVYSVIYPDYSAFPTYYQTFDNSDHQHVSVGARFGVGVGFGFGDGGFHSGYFGRGHFGGRH